ncbi:MAG: phage holin family protein [Planctomycetota bacterium]|nr:phage holin family protein [Planctomycetota bacterium]
MKDTLDTPIERIPTSLVGKIVKDLQVLVDLQFRLAQANVERELKQRAMAMSIVALGGAMLGLSAILASMGCVHFLHWLVSPAADPPEWLPMWGCFAIVTALIAMAGGATVLIGRRLFRAWGSSFKSFDTLNRKMQ